jgi:hypothetical protein
MSVPVSGPGWCPATGRRRRRQWVRFAIFTTLNLEPETLNRRAERMASFRNLVEPRRHKEHEGRRGFVWQKTTCPAVHPSLCPWCLCGFHSDWLRVRTGVRRAASRCFHVRTAWRPWFVVSTTFTANKLATPRVEAKEKTEKIPL